MGSVGKEQGDLVFAGGQVQEGAGLTFAKMDVFFVRWNHGPCGNRVGIQQQVEVTLVRVFWLRAGRGDGLAVDSKLQFKALG